jgi:uridine kinase
MGTRSSGARLIVVCGLPGSGKTTHAKQLQARLRAIRLCPDEWMDALSLDIWDDGRREKMESLQWQFGQQLLILGLTDYFRLAHHSLAINRAPVRSEFYILSH